MSAIYAYSSYAWHSPYVIDPKLRPKFKVLYDKTIVLNEVTPTAVITGRLQQFAKTVMTAGSNISGKNMVYLIVSSDSGAASHPSADFSATLEFYD
jgi:hypothetical protein